jgi:ribulose-phosphate 3-epimerase
MNDVDLILVMSVNPGFGGQVFVERVLHKISEIRAMLDEAGSEADLEVDGGITTETAERVVAAGASVLVAGTAIFQATDGVTAAVRSLREAAQRGLR